MSKWLSKNEAKLEGKPPLKKNTELSSFQMASILQVICCIADSVNIMRREMCRYVQRPCEKQKKNDCAAHSLNGKNSKKEENRIPINSNGKKMKLTKMKKNLGKK